MGKSMGVREIVLIFSLGLIALLIGTIASPLSVAQTSVELGVTATSPLGVSAGEVVPASCPSYAHIVGECTPPFSVSDQTGSGGTGTDIVVLNGSTVKLTWACINSSSSSGGNFSTGGAVSGNVNVTPSTTTIYTLVCSNGGQSTTKVTVSSASLTVTANPALVRSGNTSVISWSASNVTSCTMNGPGISASGVTGSATTPAITAQSTYTLSCVVTGLGTVSRSVTVGLVPKFEEI